MIVSWGDHETGLTALPQKIRKVVSDCGPFECMPLYGHAKILFILNTPGLPVQQLFCSRKPKC
jgi:hypothetical protein